MKKPSKYFGANLKKARLAKGISQNTLCKKLGVDRAYISAIENGRQNPTLATIEKIAKALGVPSRELMAVESRMKTVGIIGGLGPETTAEFYVDIVFSCYQKDKTRRPPVVISSVPLPYKLEEDLIMGGTDAERYLPFLVAEAKRLEKAGADFIVMPCNSLHLFIDEIRKSVSVPVLSIVEETIAFLKSEQIDKVGIVSTSAVLKNKLYENAFRENGIRYEEPDAFQQAQMGKIILNLVMGQQHAKDRETLVEVIGSFEDKGVTHVALACTDLQLLIPKHPALKIFDTMKVFADATVKYLLGE